MKEDQLILDKRMLSSDEQGLVYRATYRKCAVAVRSIPILENSSLEAFVKEIALLSVSKHQHLAQFVDKIYGINKLIIT